MSRGILVVAWHCVIAYACQYVCSAWCLTCDLRLCLGRNYTSTLTRMRLSFAMAITMAALAVYLQNMDLRAAATLFPSTLGALLAPRCALRALLCAPWRTAYACPLPHASSPLCTSCTVACARLRRALPRRSPPTLLGGQQDTTSHPSGGSNVR